MIIRRISNDFQIIEDFLNGNFSSPTHWPDWNVIVSKYYHTDFFYFAAYDKKNLIGICPAHRVRIGRLFIINSGQFHFIPNGGWIFKNDFNVPSFSLPLKPNESFVSIWITTNK